MISEPLNKQIKLVPYTPEYFPYFKQWLSDQELMDKMDMGPFDEEEIQMWPVNPEQVTLVVIDEAGAVIGFSNFHHFSNNKKIAKHGTFVDTLFQGKGYGKLILQESIQYGFQKLGLDTIEVSVKESNLVSRKNIEARGFVFDHFDPQKHKYYYYITNSKSGTKTVV